MAVSRVRAQVLTQAKQKVPVPVAVRALIDTGASCTCIDPGVFAKLSLSPTGKTSMITPSTGATPQLADQYDVGLFIVGSANEPPLFLPSLPVTASVLQHQGFEALIGRDILAKCLFTYNGDMGTFTLAF